MQFSFRNVKLVLLACETQDIPNKMAKVWHQDAFRMLVQEIGKFQKTHVHNCCIWNKHMIKKLWQVLGADEQVMFGNQTKQNTSLSYTIS
jgi:hypothetical protein